MDYYTFLELKPDKVYSLDGYGGIQCIYLDWEQDAAFIRGDAYDEFDSLQDLFEELECYLNIEDVF